MLKEKKGEKEMNLNTLHYIVKIYEKQNITKAANDLFISQSALSQNLQTLENELETLLFDRTVSPLQPTQAGKIFIDWAKCVLDSETEMRHRISDITIMPNRILRVGLSPQKSVCIFPKIIKKFYESVSHCKIILEEHPSDLLLPMLDQNAIDLLFDVPHSDLLSYDFIPIAEEKILIAAPAEFVLKNQKTENEFPSVELPDIIHFPFISLSQGQYLGKIVKELYRMANCSPNICMECRSADMALNMVKNNLGITVIPEFAIRNTEKKEINYYQLHHPVLKRTVGVLYKRDTYLNQDCHTLIHLLKEEF